MCMLGQLSSSLYFFLITQNLNERFTHVIEQLQQFAYVSNEIDSSKVDQHLHEFNVLIDELHKCNFFWSKLMAYNYYICLTICCIELLVGEYLIKQCLINRVY